MISPTSSTVKVATLHLFFPIYFIFLSYVIFHLSFYYQLSNIYVRNPFLIQGFLVKNFPDKLEIELNEMILVV